MLPYFETQAFSWVNILIQDYNLKLILDLSSGDSFGKIRQNHKLSTNFS